MPREDTATMPAPTTTQRTPPSFTDQLVEPLSRLRNEVDRLFDDFPFRLPSLRLGLGAGMAPALEMKETKKAYKISAELPGIDAEGVAVSVDNGLLRISGDKAEEREEDEEGYHLAGAATARSSGRSASLTGSTRARSRHAAATEC